MAQDENIRLSAHEQRASNDALKWLGLLDNVKRMAPTSPEATGLDLPSTDDKPTLRDQLAMAAPQYEILYLLSDKEPDALKNCTQARYRWADAMLEARKPK